MHNAPDGVNGPVRKRGWLWLLAGPTLALFVVLSLPITAQDDATDPQAPTQTPLPEPDAIANGDLDSASEQADRNLREVQAEIDLNVERIAEIRAQIEALDGDAAQLSAELIAAGERVGLAAEEVRLIEERLEALFAQERAIRTRLDGHDRSIASLLASLQRISANPPPAMLVDPADAVGSARAALLLSAVLPQLQQRAAEVTSDLEALQALKTDVEAEADELSANLQTLREERLRISTIIQARTRGMEWLSEDLLVEQAEAQALADRATSLEQLIEGLETRIAAVTAADAASRAAQAGQSVPALDEETLRVAFSDADRTEPAVPLASARGFLTAPVAGEPLLSYGASDGYGGTAHGVAVVAQPEAEVAAPADGWVVYKGPFLNYGQIVILHAGQDYMFVLAGLDRIDVDEGQFLKMGETLGALGAEPIAHLLALDPDITGPTLYVELREDGVPIDPEGWWHAVPVTQESGTS